MNKLAFCVLLLASATQSFSQNTISVLFNSDSYQLTPFQADNINVLLKDADCKFCSISISAHTDPDGTDAYNVELSRKRLTSVRNYLEKRYTCITIQEAQHHGENRLLNDSRTSALKALNRRVELTLNCQDDNNDDQEDELQDVWSSINQLPSSERTLTVDGARGGRFELDNGAILYVGANNFKPGQINLRVSQGLNHSDALKHGLTTQLNSTGELLESAGMYRIRAYQGSQLVPNLKANDIRVYIPIEDEDYQTFTGVKNNNYVEWIAQERSDLDFFKPTLALQELYRCSALESAGVGVKRNPFCGFFWCQVRSFFSKSRKKAIGNYCMGLFQSCESYSPFMELYSKEIIKEFGSEAAFTLFLAKSTPDEALERLKEIIPDFEAKKYFVMDMPDYNWINCDRFARAQNTTSVVVPGQYDERVDARLYFKDINSVMAGTPSKNGIRFPRIPVGQIATLVIVKKINDVLMISQDEFKVGEKPRINFKPSKSEALESLF
ncbi:MAG: OmpA family protein [Bacteroidia bacterium]|nr:OmpA family protein [Bacteroidia bacterium]